MVEILIHQGAVLTAEGWQDPGYVTIQDGKIHAMGSGEAPQEYKQAAREIISARNQAVMPGLSNGHTHLSQVFMRGLAGGKGLLEWLSEVVWPIQRVLSPQDIYLAARLGLAETIRAGVTDIVDHHKITTTPGHTDMVLQAAAESGVNFRLAWSWSDLGENPQQPSAILAELERLLDNWKEHPFLAVDSGPLALWRCSAETLQKTHQLASRYGRKTHCHVAETRDEIRMSQDAYGMGPVAWLDDLGVLDEATELVHVVWVTDDEIDRIAGTGACAVHCPVSNGVLGSGIAPLGKLLAAGVDLRLGTDGPASNDTQDIWETAKLSLCLARASAEDPTLLPPQQLLSLAMGGKTLQPGEAANLIIVGLEHPRYAPLQDLTSALALGGRGDDVSTVIAGGKFLMRDRQLLTLDEDELLQQSRVCIKDIRKKVGLEK